MERINKIVNETLFKRICKRLDIEYYPEMIVLTYINKSKTKKHVFVMEGCS